MPSQYITFRWDYNHREANVPYFSGARGVTPPAGNTFGSPGAILCLYGSLAASTGCGAVGLWQAALRKSEERIILAGSPKISDASRIFISRPRKASLILHCGFTSFRPGF